MGEGVDFIIALVFPDGAQIAFGNFAGTLRKLQYGGRHGSRKAECGSDGGEYDEQEGERQCHAVNVSQCPSGENEFLVIPVARQEVCDVGGERGGRHLRQLQKEAVSSGIGDKDADGDDGPHLKRRILFAFVFKKGERLFFKGGRQLIRRRCDEGEFAGVFLGLCDEGAVVAEDVGPTEVGNVPQFLKLRRQVFPTDAGQAPRGADGGRLQAVLFASKDFARERHTGIKGMFHPHVEPGVDAAPDELARDEVDEKAG